MGSEDIFAFPLTRNQLLHKGKVGESFGPEGLCGGMVLPKEMTLSTCIRAPLYDTHLDVSDPNIIIFQCNTRPIFITPCESRCILDINYSIIQCFQLERYRTDVSASANKKFEFFYVNIPMSICSCTLSQSLLHPFDQGISSSDLLLLH